jgi:hypothetical protein
MVGSYWLSDPEYMHLQSLPANCRIKCERRQTVALIEYSVLIVRTVHAQPVGDPSVAGECSLG